MLQGWHGETPERETTVTDLGEDSVTIAGTRIPCHVEQAESITAGGRIVTKTWFSDRVSPYVLRREITTYDRDRDEIVSQTQVEVVALSRAIRLLRRHRQAAELRVVHTHPGGDHPHHAAVEPRSARRRGTARIRRVRRRWAAGPAQQTAIRRLCRRVPADDAAVRRARRRRRYCLRVMSARRTFSAGRRPAVLKSRGRRGCRRNRGGDSRSRRSRARGTGRAGPRPCRPAR